MTFPIVEIFCPDCNYPMKLVNKPNLVDCNPPVNRFDKQIDYHYQCNSDDKKGTSCFLSANELITVMRIQIPKLDLDTPYSTPTAGYPSYPSNNTGFPVETPNIDLGFSIIPEKEIEQEPIINSFQEMREKAELIRKKYPNEKDFINRFSEAGQKIVEGKNLSDEEIYGLMKDSVELINPINLCLPKEEYFKQINEKYLKFMNNCIDIILSEDV